MFGACIDGGAPAAAPALDPAEFGALMGTVDDAAAAPAAAPPAAPAAAAEAEVDVMVQNLKQRFRQSGVALPLEKHSGCVYRLGAKKLSLNLRNSRLMVRVGGGYADFLEYLSKASI
jgi:hypothetical protein